MQRCVKLQLGFMLSKPDMLNQEEPDDGKQGGGDGSEKKCQEPLPSPVEAPPNVA